MVFNSYVFILLFFPLTVAGYFLINKFCYGKNGVAGLFWLLGMSLVFYAYDEPASLLWFAVSILVNFFLGKLITDLKRKRTNRVNQQRFTMVVGIVFNVGLLMYFKYTGFLLDILNGLDRDNWISNITLPLGISFFTFSQISYIVDCYREEKEFDYSFIEYAAYVTFFPKLVMGPIAYHSEIVPQFRERMKKQPNYNNLSCGFYVFALGLGKKVLIADTLAKFVNIGYVQPMETMNSITAIIVILSYTLQLYFDFSGYCDMAVGAARMINIELPYNFQSPYKAKSISEFWDRWHMTLTRFFTRYVYIPLGGSRKGKLRTYINTMIVFLLSGLWHGAAWNFVFWGMLHGVLVNVEKIGRDLGICFKKTIGIPGKIIDIVKWVITFVVINITWVFFRAESVEQGMALLKSVFSGGWKCPEYITDIFEELIEIRLLSRFGLGNLLENHVDISMIGILAILVLCVFFQKNTQEKMQQPKYNWKRSICTVGLMVWCVISLSGVSEFLYFNF